MSLFQTFRQGVRVAGIGLHSGAKVSIRLLPRDRCGIIFVRTDLPDEPEIEASMAAISSTTHATTLCQGEASVSTTEHLLAALWMFGITHGRIELDGPEIPILDGSAAVWCRLLEEAGGVAVSNVPVLQRDENALQRGKAADLVSSVRPLWALREPVLVENGNASVLALPHKSLRVSTFVDFRPEYLSAQLFDGVMSQDVFAQEIAPARTFTLEEWIEPLRAQGLIQGGSVENALVLGREAPFSVLRFSNELARHKALDLLGDIALLFAPEGGLVQAHFIALRAGHSLHRQWMVRCLEQNALVRIH
jgi:UDP-3-O-[3-hydroxymyristoyl] N-acetylglucosamine deacetylase